jgi:hypothetical protein
MYCTVYTLQSDEIEDRLEILSLNARGHSSPVVIEDLY